MNNGMALAPWCSAARTPHSAAAPLPYLLCLVGKWLSKRDPRIGSPCAVESDSTDPPREARPEFDNPLGPKAFPTFQRGLLLRAACSSLVVPPQTSPHAEPVGQVVPEHDSAGR